LHNLTAFDVVLCRNVMIYFGAAVIEAIVENLHRCLVDGGWLLVGHAEHNPETFRRFQARTLAGAIVYQRIDRRNAENEPPTMAPQAAIPTELPATPPHQPDRPIRAASLTHEPPRQLRDDGRRSTAECLAEMTAIRRLADQGEVEAAAARCRRLIRVDKLSPVCRFYQALMFEQLGDHAACEQALRRAIYLDRGYAPAHYYLGLTLLRLSRRDEAVRALRTARRLSSAIEPTRILDDFDGLTAGELNELTRMQLEAVDA
jgi:chemotaxis protein methyltransferase CheR